MKIVIKEDGSFQHIPDQLYRFVHNGRELHCDVDSLIADYKGKPAELINVNEVFKSDSKVDFEYAMKTDTNNPIIIVRFDDGTHEVLDGNHRLFKAVHEGQTYIKVHIINELELNKYDRFREH